MPLPSEKEISEDKKQKLALQDLHAKFNKYIKFIANRTYLQKFPAVKKEDHQYDPKDPATTESVKDRQFSKLLTESKIPATGIDVPAADIDTPDDIDKNIEAEYKDLQKKKKKTSSRYSWG